MDHEEAFDASAKRKYHSTRSSAPLRSPWDRLVQFWVEKRVQGGDPCK
jgi:hypothetical protein